MSFSTACPGCAARLKIARMPSKGKKIQCPQCGESFIPSSDQMREKNPASAPGLLERKARRRSFEEEGEPSWIKRNLALVVVFLLVVAGSGVGLAYFFTRPPRPQDQGLTVSAKETIPSSKSTEPKKTNPNQDDPEKLKRKQDFDQFMKDADLAIEKKDYKQAIALLEKAKELFPEDVQAAKRWTLAQSSLLDQNTQEKVKLVKQEYDQKMKEGESALLSNQYQDAIDAFTDALKLFPKDARAEGKLTQARTALAAELAQMEIMKLKLDYGLKMKEGEKALAAKQYPDAIAAFDKALKLFPGDAEASRNLKNAQAAHDDQQLQEKIAQNEKALKEKLAQKEKEQKEKLAQTLKAAKEALDSMDYQTAKALYNLALKEAPNDLAAKTGVILADKGLEKIAAKDVGKKKADFDSHITAANKLLTSGKYNDALLAVARAQLLFPENALAAQLQRQIENQWQIAKNDAKKETKKEPKKGDDKKYQNYMNKAETYLLTKNYVEAEKQLLEALLVMPADPLATQKLQLARQAMEAFSIQLKFWLEKGDKLLSEKKYQEAFILYLEASKLSQDRVVLDRLKYSDSMVRGSAALELNRFQEAAQYFKVALQVLPRDFLAEQGYREALNGLNNFQAYTNKAGLALKAMNTRQWEQAHNLFTEAFKLFPGFNDPLIQQKARYAEHMTKGLAARKALNYPEARKHFEAALQEGRGDQILTGLANFELTQTPKTPAKQKDKK